MRHQAIFLIAYSFLRDSVTPPLSEIGLKGLKVSIWHVFNLT